MLFLAYQMLIPVISTVHFIYALLQFKWTHVVAIRIVSDMQ